MIQSLTPLLDLLVQTAMSARELWRDSRTGCRFLVQWYRDLERLVEASEELVSALDALPRGNTTEWAGYVMHLDQRLERFKDSLRHFLESYSRLDGALEIRDPDLRRSVQGVVSGKYLLTRLFADWFHAPALSRDGKKLRIRILRTHGLLERKLPVDLTAVDRELAEGLNHEGREIPISTVAGKHEALDQARANLEELTALKERLRRFICEHCSFNDTV